MMLTAAELPAAPLREHAAKLARKREKQQKEPK